MHFSSILPLLPLTAYAAQISVDVGKTGLAFSPNNVKANAGDQVVFTFSSAGHSVTQSTFGQPCQASPGGINSGFVDSGTFAISVNDTNPIWLYCAQTEGKHCQSGMAMVINQPASGQNTIQNYINAAANAGTSTIGSSVSGGVLSSGSSTSTSTGSTSSPTSSPGPSTGSGGSNGYGSSPAPNGATTTEIALWAVLGSAAVLARFLI